MVTLKYSDERDRAYGLGGMVVCMGVMESEQFIDTVSIDAESDEGLRFTPDFFYLSNPQLSAKAVWNDRLNHFQLLTGLVISNLLSRAMLKNHESVSRELSDLLLGHISDEGKHLCSLEDDEIKALYTKTFNYFQRFFNQREVEIMVGNIVDGLIGRRTLTNEEVQMFLRPMKRW